MHKTHRLEEVDLTKSLRQGPSQLVVTRIEDSQGWEECLIGTGVWEWPTAYISLSVCPQDTQIAETMDKPSV